ncbi:hypothetical protein PAT3040_06311, partial [Paenibacillus agaridevorans]
VKADRNGHHSRYFAKMGPVQMVTDTDDLTSVKPA